jgi:hypothetical protein
MSKARPTTVKRSKLLMTNKHRTKRRERKRKKKMAVRNVPAPGRTG